MIRRRLLNQSLANRYTILATLLVLLTTVLLGFASANGVYRMALREESARLRAQRDFMLSEVAGHLQTSNRILRTLSSRELLGTDGGTETLRAIATVFANSAEYVHGIVLIESDGGLVSEYPVGSAPASVDLAVLASQVSPSGAYRWVPSTDGRGGSLWAIVPVAIPDGADRVLLARVRTAFVDTALRRLTLSDEQPTAFFVDGSRFLLFAAGDPDAYRTGQVEYTLNDDSADLGTVEISVDDSVRYRGEYGDLAGFPGLDWRCVVVEPSDFAREQTWAALRPAIMVWSVSAMFVVILTIGGVALLVRPLRLLDAHARAAASGALIEPLEITRRDEVGRLIESFNSVAGRLRRMHDASQLLARSVDRDEVLDGIISSLSHMLGVGSVDVFLCDEDSRDLRLVRAVGVLGGSEGLQVDPDASAWLSRAIETRGVEAFDMDTEEDPIMALHDLGGSNACGIATAFVKGTEVLGVVVVICDAGRRFSDAETDMIRSFVAQASVALDNARLFAEERRSRREAELLRKTAELLSGPEELRTTLKRVAALQADALGMHRSWVVMTDADAYGVVSSEDAALDARFLATWEAWGSGPPETAPVLLDMQSDAGLATLAEALGTRFLLLTPLYRGTDLAGLIVLGDGDMPSSPDRHGLAISETIGNQVGLALDVAYLFDQARGRADTLETIFRISQAVSSSLQSKVVLNRVLDVVQKIFSADAVMLMTYERDRKMMVVPMARGIVHPEMLDMTFAPGTDVPGRVFVTKEPERLPNLCDVESRLAKAACAQGLASAIFVPLLARGRSIGVLALFGKSADAFTEEDMELLRTFGSQAALAIDTANLFSREHHVATVLKDSILPTRLSDIAGIDASSNYVAAGTELEIGGDYYDMFLAPGGRVVLAIGDVCGKGVEAATKTSMIKYVVRGMIAAGSSPGPVLLELNRALVESGDPSDIVTLWLGMLRIDDGDLVWANGGHPPGLLLTTGGEIRRLETTGALLGAVASADFGESRVTMTPGSTLLLYTDGVTEARGKARFFGEGRVRRALRQGGESAMVSQRLLAAVQRFSAGQLRDDAAILVVRMPEATDGAPEPVTHG